MAGDERQDGDAARISVLGSPARPDHPAAILILIVCGILSLAILALLLVFFGSDLQEAWRNRARPDQTAPAVVTQKPVRDAVPSARPAIPAPDRALAHAGLRGNPGQYFGAGAYPAEAIRANEQGRTVARLAIDASGTPVGCTIAVSSGSRSLDAATCAIAIGKVRFTPARDDKGVAIASSYTLPVRWVLPRY